MSQQRNPLLFPGEVDPTRVAPLNYEPPWEPADIARAQQLECDAGWSTTEPAPLEHRLTRNQKRKLNSLVEAFRAAYKRIIHQG